MPVIDLQKELFNTIKNTLPPHISLVDTLTDLLGLSYDSVYRRVRGEKPITLNELKVLCEHFHLSIDQLLQLTSENVVFNAPTINGTETDFTIYLNGLLNQLKYFNSFEKKEMLHQCKDAPIFYFYLFPEIAAFKTFCWIKTIQNHPDYDNKIFSIEEFPFTACCEVGREIIKQYNILPTVELWNYESLNSTINQIDYYYQANLFKNRSDFDKVLDSFEKMLSHLHDQTKTGKKYLPGDSNIADKTSFKLYINEVIMLNNTYTLNLDGDQQSIITYNTLDYLITKDKRFNAKILHGFNSLLSKSTLISGTGEKERNRFFRVQQGKIERLRKL